MHATNSHNPLDVLVISQLTALKRHEAVLQKEVETGNSRNAISELLWLRESADRLNRMIDAMGVGGSFSFEPLGEPILA